MRSYIFAIAIFIFSTSARAQFFNYETHAIDSAKLFMKFDSAVKANPDFGYTSIDSTLLFMQILSPEDWVKIMEKFGLDMEDYDPYSHISSHLEGGWEVAALSTEEEYYLIKHFRGDKYWVKQLSKSSKNDYYKSSLILYKIDCREGKLGVVQTTEYNVNGSVEYSSSTRDDIIVSMSYATPDTIGEALLETACD
jgi:hypothetical protein